MDAFIPMLTNVLIFIALAVPGFLLVKSKILKQEHSGVLSKLLMYVGMPFLILSATMGVSFNGETVLNILWSAIITTVLTFIFFFISVFITTKNNASDKLLSNKIKGVERFCAIFSNNGFLGLPLAAAVFGMGEIFTYLVIANIVNNTIIYTLGVYLISGDKKTINLKNIFLNPVLIAFVLGVVLNLVGFNKIIPQVMTFSDYFKNIVTPLSMTILGMKMGDISFVKIFSSWKMYYVSLLKLIVVPAISVACTILLNVLFGLNQNMIMTMFIAFSMPTAALATAFADCYNGDVENSTIYTLGTTILSVITIPLLYLLLCLII